MPVLAGPNGYGKEALILGTLAGPNGTGEEVATTTFGRLPTRTALGMPACRRRASSIEMEASTVAVFAAHDATVRAATRLRSPWPMFRHLFAQVFSTADCAWIPLLSQLACGIWTQCCPFLLLGLCFKPFSASGSSVLLLPPLLCMSAISCIVVFPFCPKTSALPLLSLQPLMRRSRCTHPFVEELLCSSLTRFWSHHHHHHHHQPDDVIADNPQVV